MRAQAKPQAASPFLLALADGARWLIRAGDPQALRVVAGLAAAMQLRPQPQTPSGPAEGVRELLAVVQRGKTPPGDLSGPGPVVCVLPPLLSDDLFVIGMSHLALTVARDAQSRGGVLVHAGLAVCPCPSGAAGVLLAGPGSVGKTTASRRLPPPWRSLSDDAALVVRDLQGRYWAHPWPTWSRFYGAGPGGTWDVQRAVPLRALFFLSQSPEDRVEPLSAAQATTMLMAVVQHVSGSMTRCLSGEEIQALHREQLVAVEDLTRALPTCTLHLSLSGAFWTPVERLLAQLPPLRPSVADEGTASIALVERADGADGDEAAAAGEGEDDNLDGGVQHVVYTGPSMNPTLSEPDLLEVAAYRGRRLQPGDVIYFRPPDGGREIVHRVVRVVPGGAPQGGVQTRGDNNPQEDPYLLQPEDIIGQVVAAQRGTRRRGIAGGWRGVLRGMACRPWRAASRGISRLLHRAYRVLAGAGRFGRLLPVGLRPRVVVFRARQQTALKLLMGRHLVGRYEARERQWRIRRPFRLLVDEAGLPSLAERSRRAPGTRYGEAPGRSPSVFPADRGT